MIDDLIIFLISILNDTINFLVSITQDLGYFGVFIMMFLESSFFPFPSEIAIIPAGYLASKGIMNIYFVIIAGTIGSLAGSLFNYFLALKYGRIFILKYGKYVFFKSETLDSMEIFFNKHGSISIFTGRFIPVVRQFISLPAGLAKMNLLKFIIYTSAGACIWVTILAILGYFIGENQDLIKEYIIMITFFLLAILFIIVLFYIFMKRNKQT